MECSKRNRRPLHALPVLSLLCTVSFIPVDGEPSSGPGGLISDLTASGSNELRLARGYDITADIDRPWDYLVNSSDIRLGVRRLYAKLRFDIEEPSVGFGPYGQIHREYLSRRTLGFENDLLTIEAGHVATQFGRGLALSLREDREVELYSILDGVFGQVRHPRFTVQAVAGRPYQWRNDPVPLFISRGSRKDTLLTQNTADLYMRDLIAGVNAELFAPTDKAPFSLLSSGSIGGGIVRYSTNVGPLSNARTFWDQDRHDFYLPSIAVNFSAGSAGFSAEQAWMTSRNDTTFSDSVRGAFDSTIAPPPAMSTYLAATAGISSITLTAEYKNYFYDRNNSFSQKISPFLIPPGVRYQHSWHLLGKYQFSNLMNDVVGYKLLANWQAMESGTLSVDISYGGRHRDNSRTYIAPDGSYWEAYAEWAQEPGDKLNVKAAVDWGKLDPERPKVTFRTLACEIEAGPFAKRHSFGLIIESQLKDKPFLAERDQQALSDLIFRTVPADSIIPSYPITMFDRLVPNSERSHYTQYAFNLLATISYGFSPWVSLAVTLEHETGLENDDYVHIVSELASPKRNYASIGVSVKPSDNHAITVEYGSMSGGKKCSLGTCVDLPPFKGLKVTAVSRF